MNKSWAVERTAANEKSTVKRKKVEEDEKAEEDEKKINTKSVDRSCRKVREQNTFSDGEGDILMDKEAVVELTNGY